MVVAVTAVLTAIMLPGYNPYYGGCRVSTINNILLPAANALPTSSTIMDADGPFGQGSWT